MPLIRALAFAVLVLACVPVSGAAPVARPRDLSARVLRSARRLHGRRGRCALVRRGRRPLPRKKAPPRKLRFVAHDSAEFAALLPGACLFDSPVRERATRFLASKPLALPAAPPARRRGRSPPSSVPS
jgi:hypothetical protein